MSLKRIVVIALALTLSISDIAFRGSGHAEFWWHVVPIFDLVYGFLGCGIIVLVSKWIGARYLQKDEDYYERKQ